MFPSALRLSRHDRHSHRIAAVAALLLGAVAVAPSAQAATKGGVRLRVMAYNIQAGAGADHVFDLERQARAIESELAPLWTRLTDAMTVVGQRATPTWPADVPTKRIDYVTYSSGIRALDAHVPDTLASDHRPVVTDLTTRSNGF